MFPGAYIVKVVITGISRSSDCARGDKVVSVMAGSAPVFLVSVYSLSSQCQ